MLAVAIGADQAVTECDGAEMATDFAGEGFIGARGWKLFNRLIRHEIQSALLFLMQGGGVRFDFAVMIHHLFGDPHAVEQGEDDEGDSGPMFDF